MAILLYFLVTLAEAQLFGSAPAPSEELRALTKSIDEFEALELSAGFEDRYRTLILDIERQFDFRRSSCTEVPVKAERERCFRDVVGLQKRYLTSGHRFKRLYLEKIHQQQLQGLDEAHAQALKELERQF